MIDKPNEPNLNRAMITQESNLKHLNGLIEKLVHSTNHETFVLIDGDRTLSPEDSTHSFLKYSSIDYDTLEACFEKTHYSFSMFLDAAKLYSTVSPEDYLNQCEQAAQDVEVHPEFIDFIQQIHRDVQVVVITAGLRVLWDKVLEKVGIRDQVVLIGGNHFGFDKYIIDQVAKGHVVDQLHAHGKQTIAMGDSLVDYNMITKAHKGFLVVEQRRNPSVINLVQDNKDIAQISFTDYVHENMTVTTLSEILEQYIL